MSVFINNLVTAGACINPLRVVFVCQLRKPGENGVDGPELHEFAQLDGQPGQFFHPRDDGDGGQGGSAPGEEVVIRGHVVDAQGGVPYVAHALFQGNVAVRGGCGLRFAGAVRPCPGGVRPGRTLTGRAQHVAEAAAPFGQ